jgi:DNA-directed RNA polymerase specialized sigma24 family protein/CheY-like chemotaxis protein
MSAPPGIAQYLPYLRRYARALSGTQGSGDAYVVASLEAILREPDLLDACEKPRLALFRVFSTIWNSIAINGVSDPPGDTSVAADRRLGHITPRARQAFLLVSLEGFSEAEAAQVLDTDVAEVRRIVDQAGREMAAEIATDVLVIEDEPLIAAHLEGLVESIGHRIIGNARTHQQAVTFAKFKRPGLILADIKLADGSSGLDAVNELLDSFEVPVIFITAYPERFLTGERPEPAFLISKPFQPALISAVVSQALFFERNASRRGRHVTA